MNTIVIDAENSAVLHSVGAEFVIMLLLVKKVVYPLFPIFIDMKLTDAEGRDVTDLLAKRRWVSLKTLNI